MGISLDASTKIVSITSPTTSTTVQELVNAIRDWEAEQDNMAYTHVIDAAGKSDLGGGVTTGITMTLSSTWQIQYWSGVVRGTLDGGNVVGGVGGIPMKNTGGADSIFQLGAVDTTIATAGSAPTVDQIADGVWDEILTEATHNIPMSAGRRVRDLTDEIGGKWEITGNQMIFYKADNITEIMRFNLYDVGGNPTMTNVYKRERVP